MCVEIHSSYVPDSIHSVLFLPISYRLVVMELNRTEITRMKCHVAVEELRYSWKLGWAQNILQQAETQKSEPCSWAETLWCCCQLEYLQWAHKSFSKSVSAMLSDSLYQWTANYNKLKSNAVKTVASLVSHLKIDVCWWPATNFPLF